MRPCGRAPRPNVAESAAFEHAGDGPRAFFIRGQLAPTLIRLLDGSGDGKLDAAELQAALDTARGSPAVAAGAATSPPFAS